MPGLPEASANYMLVSGVTGSVLLSAITASKTKEAPARLAPWWPISKEQHCPHIGLPCAWHKAFIIKPTAQQLISMEVPGGLSTVWHAPGSTWCNCAVHSMLALYQDYCVCAKKISPSGRLTYWGVLNTWSHPSKMSNKRSHYQTIQLLYKRPVCPCTLCLGTEVSFAGAGFIFSGQCQERQHGQRNMCHWIWRESSEMKLRTCCMYPFVAHLSPATVWMWWPGETLHMMNLLTFSTKCSFKKYPEMNVSLLQVFQS